MKKIYDKYRYFLLIALAEAVYMILELIASRVISPVFGNSTVVWTAVIGVILFSSSIGNYLGGRLSDSKNPDTILQVILLIAAFLIVLLAVFSGLFIPIIGSAVSDIRIGAILSALLLFLPPSVCFGTITPVIHKAAIADITTLGKSSGKIHAVQTIGGIAGTFAGGFWLIPEYGSTNILIIISAVTALSTLLTALGSIKKKIVPFFFYAAALAAVVSINTSTLASRENLYLDIDTEYAHVIVSSSERFGKPVRLMLISGGYSSATYIDEETKYELVSPYAVEYDNMFKADIDIKNALMIGGAAYQYPKYFISHFPDKSIDVVEIDGKVTEIAKQYFYLDDLINDYNLNETGRLGLYTDDGRIFLANTDKTYDAIMNDAFSGGEPVKTLCTVEAVKVFKSRLNSGGLYMTNIISALDGDNSKFLKAEYATLKQVFENVYIIPVVSETTPRNEIETVRNNIVIATDSVIDLDNAYTITEEWYKDTKVLTDDYCPVEALTPIF